MRIVRRSIAANEIDHELILLSVSVVSLAMAAGWFALGLPWPRCAFHDLTGLPCITCGMTRSTIQFFHGHFLAALQWNPLIFGTLCLLSIFNVYALAMLVTRSPWLRIEFANGSEKDWVRAIVIGALALNWIYLLAHWRTY